VRRRSNEQRSLVVVIPQFGGCVCVVVVRTKFDNWKKSWHAASVTSTNRVSFSVVNYLIWNSMLAKMLSSVRIFENFNSNVRRNLQRRNSSLQMNHRYRLHASLAKNTIFRNHCGWSTTSHETTTQRISAFINSNNSDSRARAMQTKSLTDTKWCFNIDECSEDDLVWKALHK
jgi:hypothetical protein